MNWIKRLFKELKPKERLIVRLYKEGRTIADLTDEELIHEMNEGFGSLDWPEVEHEFKKRAMRKPLNNRGTDK